MYLSVEWGLSLPVLIRTGEDEEPEPGAPEPDFLDEARTRYKRISASHHEPALVIAALEQASAYLGGRRPDVDSSSPRGTIVSLRFDADVTQQDLQSALLLFLRPIGIDLGALSAGLDGIGRLERHLEGKVTRKGGEFTQKRLTILLPNDGFIATANGAFVPEAERHKRERVRSEEKQMIVSEAEARRVDRARRDAELVRRLEEALRRREAEHAATAAAAPPPPPPAPPPAPVVIPAPIRVPTPAPAPAPPPAKPGAPPAAAPARRPQKTQDATGRWHWAMGPKKGKYAPPPKRAPKATTPVSAPPAAKPIVPTPAPARTRTAPPAKPTTKPATKRVAPTAPAKKRTAKKTVTPKVIVRTPAKKAPTKQAVRPTPKRATSRPQKVRDRSGQWHWAVGPKKGKFASPPRKKK